MVLDEAFSQLDTATTKRVKHIIRELKGMGRSVFLVENSEDHFDLAERIYEMAGTGAGGGFGDFCHCHIQSCFSIRQGRLCSDLPEAGVCPGGQPDHRAERRGKTTPKLMRNFTAKAGGSAYFRAARAAPFLGRIGSQVGYLSKTPPDSLCRHGMEGNDLGSGPFGRGKREILPQGGGAS